MITGIVLGLACWLIIFGHFDAAMLLVIAYGVMRIAFRLETLTSVADAEPRSTAEED